MIPTTQVALFILLLGVAPGYIARASWARARTWKGESGDLRTIIQSIVLSAVVAVLLSPLTAYWILPVRSHLSSYPSRIVIWVILSVLVIPIVIGLGAGWTTDKMFDPSEVRVKGSVAKIVNRIARPAPQPCIWDWLFVSERIPESAFLRVEFEDGTNIGGSYADQSVAFTSPETHGLYLEREWVLDENGDFVSEVEGTKGILIPTTHNVRSIRILVGTDVSKDARKDDEDDQQ